MTTSLPAPEIPAGAVRAAAAASRARYVARFGEPIKPVEEFDADVRPLLVAAAPSLNASRDSELEDVRRQLDAARAELAQLRGVVIPVPALLDPDSKIANEGDAR